MFDNVCKFLAENFSTDFATWLLGEPITLTELSPTELSLEPIRADALILLQSDQTVLHLEFQTQPKADIPFRMIDYRLRVYRRFPHKGMRQVVIYLKQTSSEMVHQNTFSIPGTRHEFEVIRLLCVAHRGISWHTRTATICCVKSHNRPRECTERSGKGNQWDDRISNYGKCSGFRRCFGWFIIREGDN